MKQVGREGVQVDVGTERRVTASAVVGVIFGVLKL